LPEVPLEDRRRPLPSARREHHDYRDERTTRRQVVNFQIYQLEKAQALDLLDRVTTRLNLEAEEMLAHARACHVPGIDDEGHDEAIETVTRLYREIEGMATQLDARETNLSVAALANLLADYDDRRRTMNAVDYFATYFTNFNTDKSDFLLAAGYALAPNDRLLYEDLDEVDWKAA
jgi:hypothetical protein